MAAQFAKSVTMSRKGNNMKPVCKRCGKEVLFTFDSGLCSACEIPKPQKKHKPKKSSKQKKSCKMNRSKELYKPKSKLVQELYSVRKSAGISLEQISKEIVLSQQRQSHIMVGKRGLRSYWVSLL